MRLGVEAAIVDGALVTGDVEIADGRIARVGLAGRGGVGTAVPGFVDLQVNGFGGVDFAAADAADYRRAGDSLLETGVTAFQPTLITASEDDLVAALHEVPSERIGPRILGVHLEGPFLSPERIGAHPPDARRDPDVRLAERLLDAGPVTYMTLAPEREGALELIDALIARGVVVSCGHSDATAEEAARAFDRGVGTVTHLFNAMRPFRHRDPGIAGAALSRDDVIVQVILDGVHLADETARVVRAAARGRTRARDRRDRCRRRRRRAVRLGGIEVEVRDGVARRKGGALAGSVVTMPRRFAACTGSAHRSSRPSPPQRRCRRDAARRDDVGTLEVGGAADIVVLDDRLEVRAVYVDGRDRVAA